MATFICDHCGYEQATVEDYVGREASCPECGMPSTVVRSQLQEPPPLNREIAVRTIPRIDVAAARNVVLRPRARRVSLLASIPVGAASLGAIFLVMAGAFVLPGGNPLAGRSRTSVISGAVYDPGWGGLRGSTAVYDVTFHVHNQSSSSVSGLHIEARHVDPRRSVPFGADYAIVDIPGGVEPGEKKQLTAAFYCSELNLLYWDHPGAVPDGHRLQIAVKKAWTKSGMIDEDRLGWITASPGPKAIKKAKEQEVHQQGSNSYLDPDFDSLLK